VLTWAKEELRVKCFRTVCAVGVSVVLIALMAPSAFAVAPPANDDFDHATVISAMPFSEHVDTSGATSAADDPTSCSPANNSVWYTFVAPVNETVSIDTFGGGGAFASAYTGSRGALAQVACGDVVGFSVAASWVATAGVSYHIMVTGGTGVVALNVNASLAPANDDFDHATVIATVPFSDHVDTSGATSAADDPTSCSPANNSVWYSFIAPVNETVSIDTFGGSFAFASAYTGSRGALTQVACGDMIGFSVAASWVATAGVTYHIMVAGPLGAGGNKALNVSAREDLQPPVITSSANASFVVGVPGSFTITTTGSPLPTLTYSGVLPAACRGSPRRRARPR
jgi:hypothetical protein